MKDVGEYCPSDAGEWRRWLELNHSKENAVWLILYRKNAPKHNLTWSEAVDEALCFAWIDSTKKTIDSERYKQYFSKRKAKSNWSRVNKEKVSKLIEKDLMTPAGYESIATAKRNGSWTLLDAVEALEVPEDLRAALANYNEAMAYFESLSKSNKKMLLYWVISAKRPETRQKRIIEIVACARECLMPKQFR